MTVPGVVLGARPLCATLTGAAVGAAAAHGRKCRAAAAAFYFRNHAHSSSSVLFSIEMDTKPLIDNTSKLHFSQGLSCPGGCFCAFFRCIFPTFAPILPMSAVISGVLWANSGLPPQNTGTVFYPCSLDRNRRNVIIFITHQHLPESDGRNINAQKHHPHRSHRRPRRG